jgi:dTDP-4-amino-4,6-dideoxygalactose transaminase
VLDTPFSPWPSFSAEEAEAVQRVLRSNRVNYWTGSECREFEREFARWSGAKHAVALANGTLALEAALTALDIGPGDEVVVTPRSFIASASCVVSVGATPVFADVEEESGNLSAPSIAAVLSPRTKAIICVHLGGWPCDLDPIQQLARNHGLRVIEDCAQAHGARYKGRSVGCIGDIAAWSFCQDKIISTGGEGGMVTTNDPDLWRRTWSRKDHGKSYAAVFEREHPPGFRWLHESFGSNWRMIEMQAAIGRIQLNRVEAWGRQRRANAQALTEALRPYAGPDGPLRLPRYACAGSQSNGDSGDCDLGCQHARYKFYCYVRPQNLAAGWSRDRILEPLNRAGVPCYQGSCSEIYLEKAFQSAGLAPPERLPVARRLGETSLMLLVHPSLTADEMQRACQVVTRVLEQAAA